MITPKVLTLAIYRSFLRVCRNGPDVFCNVNRFPNIASSSPIPSTVKETRKALRSVFERNDLNMEYEEMFAVLRECKTYASILHPTVESLPPRIPIFDFSSSAALIGEQIRFNFFEPRYLRLCKESCSEDGNGMFILRAAPIQNEYVPNGTVSILLKIVESVEAEGPRIYVHCIAGPRLKVLNEESVSIQGNKAPPLLRATEIEFDCDDANGDDQEDGNMDLDELKSQCMELLLKVINNPNIIMSMGYPPIKAEPFSFWALQFVLQYDDIESRLKWLSCRSTVRRIQYVMEVLEDIQRRRELKEPQS